jgi:hypothetical protein
MLFTHAFYSGFLLGLFAQVYLPRFICSGAKIKLELQFEFHSYFLYETTWSKQDVAG